MIEALGNVPNRDHPRMCGEHTTEDGWKIVLRGSSPHVRGARRGWHCLSERHGIIPACAGSTAEADYFVNTVGDHPRMCGEHDSIAP